MFLFFSISHPNAGYTLKTTLSFFFWVCPPLNPPLVEVLFRRDTCIVLFPFKPKTLPFEDKIKMPLFSLQGYLKTEISLWWNTTGKDSVCSWSQFYSQMKSCVSHCEFLTWPCCENKSILILSWNRSELRLFSILFICAVSAFILISRYRKAGNDTQEMVQGKLKLRSQQPFRTSHPPKEISYSSALNQ